MSKSHSPGLPLVRATFRSLGNMNFRLLVTGYALTSMGIWLQFVAQGWLVFEITGSAFSVGIVSFFSAIPLVFFALLGGWFSDRFSRRHIVITTSCLNMLQALFLALVSYLGVVEVWHIIVAAGCLGLANSFEGGSRGALVSDILDRDRIQNGVALMFTVASIGMVAGPFVFSLLIARTDVSFCFLLAALGFGSYMALLIAIRVKEDSAPDREGSGPAREKTRSFVAEVRDNIPLFLVVLAILILLGASNFWLYSVLTFLPVIAKSVLSLPDAGVGWLTTAFGVGGLLGGLLVAGWRLDRKMALFYFSGAGALLLVGFSLSTGLPTAILFLVLIGLTYNSLQILGSGTLLNIVAPGIRGRVMSLFALVAAGSGRVGAVAIGLLADMYPINTTYLVGSLLLFLLTVIVFVGFSFRLDGTPGSELH